MQINFRQLILPNWNFITEKYTRGVSAVESILVLDRLRQSVAVKEIEQTHSKQQLSMRKTASVPNFSQVIFVEINSPSLLDLVVGNYVAQVVLSARDKHDCKFTNANCFSLTLCLSQNSCTIFNYEGRQRSCSEWWRK